MQISVISPIYGCRESIQELYEQLTSVLQKICNSYEIIFVNDNCPQNSWEVVSEIAKNDKNVKAIKLSRNFGQHYAITAGLDHCNGAHVVVMDCDLQDRPYEIEKLYKKALEGYDVVHGRRVERQDSFFKTFTSKLFSIAPFVMFSFDERTTRPFISNNSTLTGPSKLTAFIAKFNCPSFTNATKSALLN